MAAHESDVARHIDRLLVAQRDHTAFGPLEQLAPIGQRQFAPVGRIAEPSPLGIAIAAREQSSNRADAMERGTASLVKRAAKPGDDRAGRTAGASDRDLAILQNLIAGVPEALGVEPPTRRQRSRIGLDIALLSLAGDRKRDM